ncbi:hypothetical protein OC861_007059, partial [Tilletia horrida]
LLFGSLDTLSAIITTAYDHLKKKRDFKKAKKLVLRQPAWTKRARGKSQRDLHLALKEGSANRDAQQ